MDASRRVRLETAEPPVLGKEFRSDETARADSSMGSAFLFLDSREKEVSLMKTPKLCSLLFVLAVVFLVMSFHSELTAAEKVRVRMATTTSTDNSGLLDSILPYFEKARGIHVDVIPVGTRKALKLAERGDVDVVMVHAPEAERAFVDAGWGVNRRAVMANDFLIVGPQKDPAEVKKAPSLVNALERIKASGARFISRGDDSGTHKKELSLWPLAGGPPAKGSYLDAGQGMEATLRIAHEKKAYTLTDRGTYLAVGKTLDLVPVCQGDATLKNPYSIIAVNPDRHRHVRYIEAMTLIGWVTSPEGQSLIGAFRKEGEVLFHPTAIPEGGDR
jgi:tungstate transport system substrate-binding protein